MKKDNATKTAIHILGLAVVVGFLFWQLRQKPAQYYESPNLLVMGTVAKMMAAPNKQGKVEDAFKDAMAELERIEAMMSDYREDSQLSEVNRSAFAGPVAVDDELFYVIAEAVRYSELSDGAFDVTVGPVVQLWRKAKASGVQPSEEEVGLAKIKIGWRNLILDGQTKTVQFKIEGMFIDLGGIAKGYAIDKAIQVLRSHGVPGGMVDVGGDIRCFGKPPRAATHWYIGLQDPRQEGTTTLKLQVNDMAVATSGDYRRFVMIDGQRYSHIIDPQKAESAKDLSSVSIIAPTAIQADALATAVSVMGYKKGLELIESLENVEAITISSAQPEQIEKTSGANGYIVD